MKKFNLFITAVIMLTLAASCGKDGAVGPQGPKGDTGATGAAGPAGANGSVIYSGTGVPAASTGATGDFYIDLSSGNFYGPKTTSGWGTPISLKGANGAAGATGAAGAPGSKILSGSGAPSASLGNTGDYYLDKTSYLFYGPKTAGGWGTGLNIQGPAGPLGPAGNANVKVDTFTVHTADWTYGDIYYFGTSPNVSSGYFAQYYDRANTDVTDAIINGGGMIMVYFQATPDLYPDLWQPLPYTFPAYAGYGYNYYYQPSAGNVRLDFFFNQISVAPPAVNTYQIPTHKFKIVVISGTLIDMVKNNHVDIKDYNAMAKITGLWQLDKKQ